MSLLVRRQLSHLPRWEGSGPIVLTPLAQPDEHQSDVRHVVYVPVYSSIYWGFDNESLELAVTLSIRNVSLAGPIIIHSSKYYDSAGNELANFVEFPSELGPMATADFVIPRAHTTGGPGANVLIEWSSASSVDEPLFEAIMIGSHGNVGVSFISRGENLPLASALAENQAGLE